MIVVGTRRQTVKRNDEEEEERIRYIKGIFMSDLT
jgi:hypothetical protein